MAFNREHFEQLKAYLREDAEHFNMEQWMCKTSREGQCHTTFCMGGACALLALPQTQQVLCDIPRWSSVEYITTPHGEEHVANIAMHWLGITDVQAMKLFLHVNWPDHFRHRYYYANDSHERVALACEVLDDFVATGGWPDVESRYSRTVPGWRDRTAEPAPVPELVEV